MKFTFPTTAEPFSNGFRQQAQILAEAATLLAEQVRCNEPTRSVLALQIAALEHDGDNVVHETSFQLNRSVISNFDSEDSQSLSSRLDDALDGIEEAAFCLTTYRPDPLPDDILRLCDIVNACCATRIEVAIQTLRAINALGLSTAIGALESEADDVSRSIIAELFSTEHDPITLLKKRKSASSWNKQPTATRMLPMPFRPSR